MKFQYMKLVFHGKKPQTPATSGDGRMLDVALSMVVRTTEARTPG
jgi:hypothetical protein